MGLWEEILSFISKKKVQSVAVSCHVNADPDGLASAFGLKALILESCPEIDRVEIVIDSVNDASMRLVDSYPEIVFEQEVTSEPSVFILVDVSNIGHIGRIAENITRSGKPLIIIDHHVPQASSQLKADVSFIDEQASSTCEIVCSLYESTGKTPSKTTATILLIGIIYDSKRFSFVGRSAFRAAAFLIDSGADYQSALSVLKHPIDRPEKIARLKAAQRSRIMEINGWIISLSEIGSFGASACRGLIDMGADAAVVSSGKKKLKRISVRSTGGFYKGTGVNLAKVMEKVGAELGATGGGHPTAATVSGMDDVNRAERLVIKYMQEGISVKKQSLKR